MVALPRVLLALVSLAGLTAAIIPGLFLQGPLGANGKPPLFGSLLGGTPPGAGLGGGGQGLLPGGGGGIPLPFGPGAHSLLGSLLSGTPFATPLGGGGGGGTSVPGGSGANNDAESAGGREGAPPASSSAGSTGSNDAEDSSEEVKDKRKRGKNASRLRSDAEVTRRKQSSANSKPGGDSSEEENGGSKKTKKNSSSEAGEQEKPRKRSGSGGSRTTRRKKGSSEEDSEEKTRNLRRRSRGRGRNRDKRSVMDEFGLMGIKGMHHAADNVPDHVKLVYCGRNEVPNPGGIEDHFCHPDSTWETLLRMRPDCICQQGYLRNSWGECISLAECDHCSDKHHLNMDYHLCESPCPIVCNQPIDENCANMCFKECACRPGYIRAYPNGPCVSIKQCLPGCRGRNQIFSLCSSLCPATCRKPVPKRCPKICAGEGCVCKPGYVVKRWEPLECVRPEDCPGRRRKCPGPNQRYTRCIRRCVPSCFKRRHRYCGHECLGRGCVCKRGYVALQRRPLVCVRQDQCPKSPKKCPARNQVYKYCKSKCPRTCDNPKPRRCALGCNGEGCACKPGYVMKQEDPLICVRPYQCSSEFDGLEMLKEAKGGMGGAKGERGGAKGGMEAEEAKGGLGSKGGIGEKGVIGAVKNKKVMGAEEAEGAKVVEGTKGRRRKKGSSKRRKPSWEFSPQ